MLIPIPNFYPNMHLLDYCIIFHKRSCMQLLCFLRKPTQSKWDKVIWWRWIQCHLTQHLPNHWTELESMTWVEETVNKRTTITVYCGCIFNKYLLHSHKNRKLDLSRQHFAHEWCIHFYRNRWLQATLRIIINYLVFSFYAVLKQSLLLSYKLSY